jgi:hypothetical protein
MTPFRQYGRVLFWASARWCEAHNQSGRLDGAWQIRFVSQNRTHPSYEVYGLQ